MQQGIRKIRSVFGTESAHFNNVANITTVSDSITPQKKQNGRDEDCPEYCQAYLQEDRHISFEKNEENKSTIAIETIEPNASNKIEQIASKIADVIKQLKNTIKTIKLGTAKDLLTCIGNILAKLISLTTPFGINTSRQISISATYQSRDTNRTMMGLL